MSATLISMPIDEKTELELWDKRHQPPSGFFSKRQSDMKNRRVCSFNPTWFDNKLWSTDFILGLYKQQSLLLCMPKQRTSSLSILGAPAQGIMDVPGLLNKIEHQVLFSVWNCINICSVLIVDSIDHCFI